MVRSENLTMVAALSMAMHDTELRHLHFTTPFQFELRKGGGQDNNKDKLPKKQQQQQQQGQQQQQQQKSKKNKTRRRSKAKHQGRRILPRS